MSTIDINDLEFEIPVSVNYNYTAGRPEVGPSFDNAGGFPAEPGEFNINEVNIEISHAQALRALENSNGIIVKIDIGRFLGDEDLSKIEEYYHEQCE